MRKKKFLCCVDYRRAQQIDSKTLACLVGAGLSLLLGTMSPKASHAAECPPPKPEKKKHKL